MNHGNEPTSSAIVDEQTPRRVHSFTHCVRSVVDSPESQTLTPFESETPDESTFLRREQTANDR